MDEFYWYRNCIAYGTKPEWNDKIWNPLEHLLIANKIFIDSIRVKFENELLLNLDIEAKTSINITDEMIKNGNIFEKDWNEIFCIQMEKTVSSQAKRRFRKRFKMTEREPK